ARHHQRVHQLRGRQRHGGGGRARRGGWRRCERRTYRFVGGDDGIARRVEAQRELARREGRRVVLQVDFEPVAFAARVDEVRVAVAVDGKLPQQKHLRLIAGGGRLR